MSISPVAASLTLPLTVYFFCADTGMAAKRKNVQVNPCNSILFINEKLLAGLFNSNIRGYKGIIFRC